VSVAVHPRIVVPFARPVRAPRARRSADDRPRQGSRSALTCRAGRGNLCTGRVLLAIGTIADAPVSNCRNKSRVMRPVAALVLALGVASAARPADPSAAPLTQEPAQALIEIWLVLSEPALATLPPGATEQRSALRARIVAEQNRVMERARALGGVETGRIQQVENALAVRLPTSSLNAVKQIDGVTSVRQVSGRNRIQD
jgi:hypothetical protein